MIPVTHFLYVAVGLGITGLAGLVLRRSAVGVAVALFLLMCSGALVLAAYARWWGNMEGQGAALVVLVLALVQLTVGLGLSRAEPREPARSEEGA